MLKDFKKHTIHFLPLLAIFIAGILGFLFFSYDRAFQIAVAIALSSAYLLWGVVHHKIHNDLDTFVFVEYLAVSALGLLMVLTLIFRT